jgi:serine/threonine-protein kinase HipA
MVTLDAAELGPPIVVGTLHQRDARGAGIQSFEYSLEWLGARHRFAIDPRLELFAGEQYPSADAPTFGVFMDSAPDRWGRLLMDRREAQLARDERRTARALRDWDYLLGVQDECRIGALRFRRGPRSPFLDDRQPEVPPVADLAELERISLALEATGAEARPQYRQWLAALVAPGTSLGGARPKANYRDRDGALWIAKFPSREDRRDIGRWEALAYRLAQRCGVTVADAVTRRFGSTHHTFCVRRFDRVAARRRLFVSAMTLLDRRDGEGGSYLEIARFIEDQGARGAVAHDLEQLFRRVAFNVLIGNTDDHLRNHGFIRERTGWRLAPAFDLNPNPVRRSHALLLDDASTEPDLATVTRTARHYRLTPASANAVVQDLRTVVASWSRVARAMRLPVAEIGAIEAAFEVGG